MGVLLLTLSLINVVKYRFDHRSSEDRIRKIEDARNEKRWKTRCWIASQTFDCCRQALKAKTPRRPSVTGGRWPVSGRNRFRQKRFTENQRHGGKADIEQQIP